MKKPHVISKEELGEFSTPIMLASNGETKRLYVCVNLHHSRPFFTIDKRSPSGIITTENYHSLDDAVAAYNLL